MNNCYRGYILIAFWVCSLAVYGQTEMQAIDTLRNIRLQEVIVTATQSNAPGTRSVIGQDAIRHIQATDLSVLSQLLPGVLVRNPDLNAPAAFTIRSATSENTTNALGTAIEVDGLRMNNNANMQQMGLEGRGSLFNSTVLSGFDVRSLSPSSVESVEVIRGVPSARYGDVTSGVVLVKSKAGIQPLTIGIRLTATEKLASVGKGIAISNNGGTLYLGADYALSNQSPQVFEESFQRFGIQAAYAKDFRSATLRLNMRGYWMKDNDKRGQNTVDGEFRKYQDQNISFSANGQWKLNRSWISNLEYQLGFTYGSQKNESSTYYSGTQQVTTYTAQAGEHVGVFLPPHYFSQLSVDGKPLSGDVALTVNHRKTMGENISNHFQLGLHAEVEGNRGKGISFDPLCPPLEMLRVRTRSYRDIPLLYKYSAFAENHFILRYGKMRTEVQAGVRFTQLPTKRLQRNSSVDPRINLSQIFIDRTDDVFLSRFSVRLGWGLMHKMPVLTYLYPDKSYTDMNCFTYNDAENNQRLTVMHTFITDRNFNSDLRLPVNQKFEIGVNFRIGGVTADVVWFKEHLKNGYCTSQLAEPFSYRRYSPLISKGEQPELTDEGVMNDGELLPYTLNTTFATYLSPQNGIEQEKQGIEYTIGPIHSKALRSSFYISGGYLDVCEKNTALSALHPQIEVNGKAYPYVGIYETGPSVANTQIWQQLNSRFQCVTQIPRIGLITSLTLQAVWMDKQQRGMESRFNNPVYTDSNDQKCLNPVYYIDGEGNQHPFTPDMATDECFADLVIRANTTTAFLKDSYKPYFLLNLRVTKEIGRHVSVAFCANNLLQSNPKRYRQSIQKYAIVNPDLYYGAEISIRF